MFFWCALSQQMLGCFFDRTLGAVSERKLKRPSSYAGRYFTGSWQSESFLPSCHILFRLICVFVCLVRLNGWEKKGNLLRHVKATSLMNMSASGESSRFPIGFQEKNCMHRRSTTNIAIASTSGRECRAEQLSVLHDFPLEARFSALQVFQVQRHPMIWRNKSRTALEHPSALGLVASLLRS